MSDLAEDSHHGKQETSASLIPVLEGTEQGKTVGIYMELGLARGSSIAQPGPATGAPTPPAICLPPLLLSTLHPRQKMAFPLAPPQGAAQIWQNKQAAPSVTADC